MLLDHTYIHERRLLQYYHKIASSMELLLVPYVRRFDRSVESLRDLTRIELVVKIKYALKGPLNSVLGSTLVRTMLSGSTGSPNSSRSLSGPRMGRTFRLGQVTSVRKPASNCMRRCRRETGPRPKAPKHLPAVPVVLRRGWTGNTIERTVSIPAIKKGLELANLHGGYIREPIKPLSEENDNKWKISIVSLIRK